MSHTPKTCNKNCRSRDIPVFSQGLRN